MYFKLVFNFFLASGKLLKMKPIRLFFQIVFIEIAILYMLFIPQHKKKLLQILDMVVSRMKNEPEGHWEVFNTNLTAKHSRPLSSHLRYMNAYFQTESTCYQYVGVYSRFHDIGAATPLLECLPPFQIFRAKKKKLVKKKR